LVVSQKPRLLRSYGTGGSSRSGRDNWWSGEPRGPLGSWKPFSLQGLEIWVGGEGRTIP